MRLLLPFASAGVLSPGSAAGWVIRHDDSSKKDGLTIDGDNLLLITFVDQQGKEGALLDFVMGGL
jgi:hypothetical protein